MRDAQIGLLIVTPMIIGMAVLLHVRGAVPIAGVIAVSIAAVFVAAVLFLSH